MRAPMHRKTAALAALAPVAALSALSALVARAARGAKVAGLAAVVTALAGCATTAPRGDTPPGRAEADVALAVPYRNAGAGFGGTAHSGMAVVPAGQHPPLVAALGLQQALSAFSAQLLAPEIVGLTAADKDISWRSDIGPLQAPQLAAYNAVAGHPRLQSRLFGVRFAGRLVIIDNELRFSIEARLAGRGAGESWQELADKDYNGQFFATQLAQALRKHWQQQPGGAP